MRLIVMTPMACELDCDEINKVRVCLDDGSWLSMYEKHAPIIAAVSASVLEYENSGGICTQYEIGAGLMQLKDDTVTIYVNETPAQGTVPGEDDAELDVASINRLTEQLLTVLDQGSGQQG